MAEAKKKPNNPNELTEEQQQTARHMLIHGATFEDVVLTLAARGQTVRQDVVENYFRGDKDLHALRAKHTVEIARAIRTELQQENPDDVDLADAVILTGLQRLNRAAAMLDVNDALRRKYERENLHLKQQVLILRARHEDEAAKFQRARTKLLSAQWQAARENLKRLNDEITHSKKGKKLTAEVAATIQEIYGLVQAPAVPPVGAPETENAQ